MRNAVFAAALLLGASSSLQAQSLRDRVGDLFRFGSGCTVSVCLDVGSGHGDHYNPAVVTGGANLIELLTNAIGISIANIPLSAASGGAIWGRSADGLPVRTATSSGPIFAERGQTLGKGRVLFAANVNRLSYRSLRGVPLDGLVFTFPHQDISDDGLGIPDFESDVIEVRTTMDVGVTAITPVITYGITDRIDLSVALPLVNASISGTSEAQIVPYSNPTPHHFGTGTNPLLRATSSADGSASGIGDVAIRVKAGLFASNRGAVALLGDVRLATGDEDNFLGTGATSFSVIAAASLRRGNFSPHLNAGYAHRGGTVNGPQGITDVGTDAVLATVGFDHLMGRNTTLAVEFISQWQIGDNPLTFPEPVTVTALVGNSSAVRVIRPINVPDRRDHIALGSVGAKFGLGPGFNLVTNAMVPLRQGGLQPNLTFTTGFEYSF
jgi:hypothetical protein